MAIPTEYDELALAEYMHLVLGRFAGRISFSVGEHSYDELVNDAVTYYGAATIAEITGAPNIEKLRMVARFIAWRAAADESAADYDFATDGQRFDRSQMHKAAVENRDKAENDLIAIGVGLYAPTSTTAIYIHDPYNAILSEDRARP